MPTSLEGELTLSAIAPFSAGLSGTARPAFSSTCHSTASTCTSTPQACLRFSCSASFIGNGSIWPEPDVEIITLNDSGFCGVKPASASSALPFAGSNV